MLFNRTIDFKSEHLYEITGKDFGKSDEETVTYMVRPDAPKNGRRWVEAEASSYMASALGLGVVTVIAMLVSIILLITGAWLAGPIWGGVAVAAAIPSYRSGKMLNMKAAKVVYRSDTSEAHRKCMEAYKRMAACKKLVAPTEWDLISVNLTDFYHEACDIMETAEQVRQIKGDGLDEAGVSKETNSRMTEALQALRERTNNLQATSSYAADAALFTKTNNLLTGGSDVSAAMVEEARWKHSTLKAIGPAGSTGSGIDDVEDEEEDEEDVPFGTPGSWRGVPRGSTMYFEERGNA